MECFTLEALNTKLKRVCLNIVYQNLNIYQQKQTSGTILINAMQIFQISWFKISTEDPFVFLGICLISSLYSST